MRKAVAAVVAVVALSLASVGAQEKYALVIGNGAYTGITALRNPVNDANDMGAALRALGFTVDLVTNAGRVRMEEAVARLKGRLGAARGAYGFFYYAGHGVQSGGENYLVPVDAAIPGEAYLRDRAVPVQAVLDELNGAGNALNIVVLDACRDNPFGWRRSGSRGLQVVSSQPADSIIVYATSAGRTAEDGTGRNGLFTAHLLNNLKKPGLSVRDVFDQTGADVRRASGGAQIPAIYSQFFEAAYLGARPAAAAPAPAAPASAQPVAPAPAGAAPAGGQAAWPGELLRTLSGHSDSVYSAAYSPDGRRIVSASADRTVKIWDAESGQLIRTLSGYSKVVNSTAYSPDGRRIVSASGNAVSDPEGDIVKVWDAETGRELRTLKGHSEMVNSASYSPDGRRVVSASGISLNTSWGSTVKIWDAESGRELRTLSGHSKPVRSAVYSPDGRRIVSASADTTVKIWDAESGRLIRTLSGHGNIVYSAAYSPDGRRIVSASGDGTVKIWAAGD